jgi:glycyl-tRNA synthetase
VLRIPAVLAPYKAAVLPLVKKDGLPEKAREIMKQLQFDYSIQYDEKDSIGKRYRRQDAIGTPFSITIDHQTLTDDMVTVRDRDTMEQIRIGISEIEGLLAEKASWKSVLSTL